MWTRVIGDSILCMHAHKPLLQPPPLGFQFRELPPQELFVSHASAVGFACGGGASLFTRSKRAFDIFSGPKW